MKQLIWIILILGIIAILFVTASSGDNLQRDQTLNLICATEFGHNLSFDGAVYKNCSDNLETVLSRYSAEINDCWLVYGKRATEFESCIERSGVIFR